SLITETEAVAFSSFVALPNGKCLDRRVFRDPSRFITHSVRRFLNMCPFRLVSSVRRRLIGMQAVIVDGFVWFRKFKNGAFCLEDQPPCGGQVAVNEEHLLELPGCVHKLLELTAEFFFGGEPGH
ncbi:unnamed protein product, partial [Heligmosomoides polygyrus]|uniref:PIPK domain-containing protein n=1 Tax=Heligmosomoides polygyrus TaxID=6339 RepID=A0A183GK87_HELPZ